MSQQQTFRVGQIVRLKSGGPNMAIRVEHQNTTGDIFYSCQWFAGKKLEDGRFPVDSLEFVKPKDA